MGIEATVVVVGHRPEQIPAEIAEHVRGCAELTSAGPIIDDDSPRLVKRYREFIREWAGVVWERPRVRAVAESAMREALLGKDNPADVINVALEQLAQQRCELPAYSTLDRLAAKIRTEVNGGFHRLVATPLDRTTATTTRPTTPARPQPRPMTSRHGGGQDDSSPSRGPDTP